MASDDDFLLSDLTECESDESSVVGKGKKPAKKPGWRIRKALQPARATTYSAQSLYDQIVAGDIDLEPEYQRDIVWPESKQIMIIDSIFSNFYIPPVIFAVKNHDDGSESKTCIDGKQRLTSIHRFMDGLIPHKDPLTSEKLWFKEGSKGPKRKLMPEKYRKVFANKQIVCVEFHEITEEDEREVFQRVQLGMALTPAEKLQVISTPRAVFVREVLNTFLREDGGLGTDSLNWNAGRATDFRCLGHAIHIMEASSQKLVISDFAQLEKWLKNTKSLDKSFKDDVMETYRLFSALVKDVKHSKVLKKYKKVAPVEFVYVPVFIYMHNDSSSLAQLADGIEAMFNHVRTIHRDVRMNNRVQKDYIEFVGKWKKNKTNGGVQGTAGTAQKRKRTTATGKNKKRKTDADDDMDVDDEGEDDSDYEEEAPKAKKVASQKPTTQKPATQKAAPSASTPISGSKPSSPQVKTEFDGINSTLQRATISAPNPPPVDRLAALRKASQNQAARAVQAGNSTLPTRTEIVNDNDKSAPMTRANPQMLPSPAQGFVKPTLRELFNSLPLGTESSSADVPLRNPSGGLPGLPRIPTLLPATFPARPTGSIPSPGEVGRRGSYDERGQNSQGGYDNHNHGRHSGNFGGNYRQRSPDDRERGRGRSESGSGSWR